MSEGRNEKWNESDKQRQESVLYHDTRKLLESYRDVIWNLELSAIQLKNSFEVETGGPIDNFLESIYQAGVEFHGTNLENHARSIERSNKMIKILNASVDLLRNKHKRGEQYYWLLYYTYLSPQELQGVEEIIEKLRPHILNLSYRTYYRKRNEAMEALSAVLWGYSTKEGIGIIKKYMD